jgi:hypothetical protein
VTLRDWLNAAVVIAKLGMQHNAPTDAAKLIEDAGNKWFYLPGGKERQLAKARFEASELIKSLVLTERDKMMLKVCNLDKETIEQAGKLALQVGSTMCYDLHYVVALALLHCSPKILCYLILSYYI